MPVWLIQILITLAIKFGLPWILKKFPSIPPEVIKIIEELIQKLEGHKEEQKALVAEAKKKALQVCTGPDCSL